MAKVLVVVEVLDGVSKKASLSAVSCGRAIAEQTSGSFDVLVVGHGASKVAGELGGYGAGKVRVADDAKLAGYVGERYAPTVSAAGAGYDVVTFVANAFGKDLAPRVAARLSAGYASDVVRVDVAGGKLTYRRPVYAGNALASMEVTTPVQVVSVRQADFPAAAPTGGASPIETVAVQMQASAERVEFLGFDEVKSTRPDLAEAKIVVSGGRALKSSDNFKAVLEPLVDALGAAMGASRAACDAGYVSNDLQVGQTGKVVAPQLYVAVGISGAIQHLAGMKNSKTIVAINKDPDAPIFQVADYGLVADLFNVVPPLAEAVRKLRAEG